MIYICIPSFDEAPTVGVLLWRIRKVFREYAREYEILVYDDASTDATREVLEPYTKALPLTVLGGPARVGYGRAVDALLREASRRTRYPRRDAVILLQADFTDQPEGIPELVKRFEGGADVVVGERQVSPSWPSPARLLHRMAPFVTRPFVSVESINDPFGTLRLYRISVLRDMLKDVPGDAPLVRSEGWAANVELLLGARKHARRIEAVAFNPRYELRPRESRVRPWRGALSLYKSARAMRGRVAAT